MHSSLKIRNLGTLRENQRDDLAEDGVGALVVSVDVDPCFLAAPSLNARTVRTVDGMSDRTDLLPAVVPNARGKEDATTVRGERARP